MAVSQGVLKWALRLYPPLFLQGIWLVRFHTDFKGLDVRIKKSFLNSNYNHSIFGGTIFAAADPFYPVLLHQLLEKKGFHLRVWVKSAAIQYLKPARTDLNFTIRMSELDLEEAMHLLANTGIYTKMIPIELFDKNDELCAFVQSEVYARNLKHADLTS
jgi:acyl-coenzyme A thioesterase PaaI-like protein